MVAFAAVNFLGERFGESKKLDPTNDINKAVFGCGLNPPREKSKKHLQHRQPLQLAFSMCISFNVLVFLKRPLLILQTPFHLNL